MKAAVSDRYGPPETVRLAELPRPEPRRGEILVRVAAAGITTGDARLRGLDVPAGFGPVVRLMVGLTRPRRPVFGAEFAGRVEALGPGAAGVAIGDRVFGTTGLAGGAHAEFLTIRADGLVLPTPGTLSDVEAAAFLFGGLTAADFLIDKAGLGRGERLLVNGATGAVGTAALQVARHLGARVTAVCSAANADLARELGAEAVIDYAAGPISGEWDVILDVIGTLPWSKARRLLAPGGRLLPVTASFAETLGAALRPRREGRRIAGGAVGETRGAMERLVGLHRAGAFRPVIGATFPLERIVEAHRLASSRRKRGNAVVLMPG